MKSEEFQGASDPASLWAVRVCVAAVFALTGAEKFAKDAPYWSGVFDAIGFGQWFRYFTGGVEVLGGLLFLVPRATTAGALVLIATMMGAVGVQFVVFHRPADAIIPGAYLVAVILAFSKLHSATRGSAPGERL
ncbi:MAG: DoxX family protein [Gemmatimonadaceae bacterium]